MQAQKEEITKINSTQALEQISLINSIVTLSKMTTNQINDKPNTDVIEMNKVSLPEMEGVLIPFYSVKGKRIFPFWVIISSLGSSVNLISESAS